MRNARVRLQAHRRALAATRLASVLLLGLVSGCSSEGKTSDCPELPLYDVRKPLSPDDRSELEAAAERGCITLPLHLGQGGSSD